MRTLVCLAVLLLSGAEAIAQDILVSRQRFTKTCDKEEFLDNTAEIDTSKALKAINTTMRAGGGEGNYSLKAIKLPPPLKVERSGYHQPVYFYPTPNEDYSICRVIAGKGKEGIEIQGISSFFGQTFNNPAKKENGHMMVAFLTCPGADVRVEGKFDLIFVKKSRMLKAGCMWDGSMAWSAQNNEITFHPKSVKRYKD